MIYILAVALMSLHSLAAPPLTELRGDIDPGFVDRLASQATPGGHIRVSSGGGSADSAAMAARIMADTNSDLIIDVFCISACAEFLIPAARSVTLGREAVLGFHGNDIAYSEIAENHGDTQSCSSRRVQDLKSYYNRRNLSVGFAQEVESRIVRRAVRLEPTSAGCSRILSETYAAYWYPNSHQLRSLWGLRSTGEICADRAECIQRRIFPLAEVGAIVVVGNNYYVTENDRLRFLKTFDSSGT